MKKIGFIPINALKYAIETQGFLTDTMKKMIAWGFPWKSFLKQDQSKITSSYAYFRALIGITLGLPILLLANMQSVKAFQPDSVFSQRLNLIQKNIPYQLTEELQDAIYKKMYTNKSASELILTRSIGYLPFIEKELWQNDLPSEFKYIPMAMSNLDPTNITYNGGAGIWGLPYIIAKRYGLKSDEIEDERRDHIKSTCVSIQYINDLQKIYGNWTLTLLSFITSPSDVNSAICRSGNSADVWKVYAQMTNKQKSLFIEFVASAYLLNYYDKYGLEKKQPEFEWANCNSCPVEVNTSFADLSVYLGISENTLKQANPTIRSHYVPGNKGYSIRIPATYYEKYAAYKPVELINLAVVQNTTTIKTTVDNTNLPNHLEVKPSNATNCNKVATGSYQTQKSYYKVKSGDNLGKIANKYNVAISSIKSWNRLKGDNIYVGQKICIQKKVWIANKVTTTTNTEPNAGQTGNSNVDVDKTNTNTQVTTVKTTTTSWVTYTVKHDDTLYKIASKYNLSVDDLKSNNSLTDDIILIGQILKIKVK